MFLLRLSGGSRLALAAGAMLATVAIAQAAVTQTPASSYSTSDIQTVDCVVGAHLGPLGACIGGDRHGDHRDHRHCWTNDRGERVCR